MQVEYLLIKKVTQIAVTQLKSGHEYVVTTPILGIIPTSLPAIISVSYFAK